MCVFLGGTASSVLVAALGKQYKSVIDILKNDLSPEQKQRLVSAVEEIVCNIRPSDVATLLPIVLSRKTVKEAIVEEIGKFLLNEFSYKFCE